MSRGIIGKVALHSTNKKSMPRVPPTVSMAITSGEFQGVPVCPPCEMAMRTRIMNADPVKRPKKSIFRTVSRTLTFGMLDGSTK
jgi:hypothetical protein